jgi:hypothetical protein
MAVFRGFFSSAYTSFTVYTMWIKQFYISFYFGFLWAAYWTPVIKMAVLLDVVSCCVVDGNQYFGGNCCLHLRVEVWGSSELFLFLYHTTRRHVLEGCSVDNVGRKNGIFHEQERHDPLLIFTAQFSNLYFVVPYLFYIETGSTIILNL